MDKKIKCLVLIAIMLAIMGIVLPESTTTSGVVFQVNNTNLAPSEPGPGGIIGTGERHHNVTYYANNSPIDLYIILHTLTPNGDMDANVSVNGTVIQDFNINVPAAADDHMGFHVIVPQYASYMLRNNSKVHHYEWREYPILTGNVSTVVTSGGGGTGGCQGNCSFDNLSINVLSKNDTSNPYGVYIHLLEGFRHTIPGLTDTFITYNGDATGDWLFLKTEDLVTLGYSQFLLLKNEIVMDVVGVTKSSRYLQAENYIYLQTDGTLYNFNKTYLDMGGSNITNCFNCVNTTDLNLKVNKSGYENVTGPINVSSFLSVGRYTTLTGSTFGVYTNTSNIPMYLYSDGRNNAKIFQDVYQGSATGANNGGGETVRVARGNETVPSNLIDSDRLFQFTGQGYKNGSFRTQFAISGQLDAGQNNTSSPTSVYIQTTAPGNVTSDNTFVLQGAGNIQLLKYGKGFTMYSPDGNDWCVTVNNAGALAVSATPCS